MRHLFLVFACALGLPACATITTGTSQSIAVITDPPGATCQLQRSGEIIAVVNPTPGTANISKSTRDIAVNCTRPGHLATTAAMPPRFQAATLGNILIGGLVGIVVDASSGAMSQYEPNVTLVLAPESFQDLPARENFFLSRIEETRRNYGSRIDAIIQACPPDNRVPCDGRVADLERERDGEVGRLQDQRRTASVPG